jgi:hypothetical protein
METRLTSFWSAVGSAAPHGFSLLSFAGIRKSTGAHAPEDDIGVKKAPSSRRFAGAVQNALVEIPLPVPLADWENLCKIIWTACSISLPVSKGAITKGKIALSASPYAAAAGDVFRLHRFSRQPQHIDGLPCLLARSVAPPIFQLRSLRRSSNNRKSCRNKTSLD